jgi:hypothetical protein
MIKLSNGQYVPKSKIIQSGFYSQDFTVRILQSGFYTSLIDSFGDQVEIPMSNTIPNSVNQDYINFLHHGQGKNQQQLKLCLQHCSLIGDSSYLYYCATQLLHNYSSYKSIIDDLNSNLKRQLYLCFPLPFSPTYLS